MKDKPILTKQQLEDAMRCPAGCKDCSVFPDSFTNTSCVRLAAHTALVLKDKAESLQQVLLSAKDVLETVESKALSNSFNAPDLGQSAYEALAAIESVLGESP